MELNKVYAEDTLGDVISGGRGFISSSDNKFSISEEELKNTSNTIYNIL